MNLLYMTETHGVMEAGRIHTQLWQQEGCRRRALFRRNASGAAAVIVGGNSSLQMMYDQVALAGARASPAGQGPWGKEAARSLFARCRADRHFRVTEEFGF